MEYPILVTATERASKGLHTIRYRIYAMGDAESLVEGDVHILVVEEGYSTEVNAHWWGNGMIGHIVFTIIGMGIFIVLSILSIVNCHERHASNVLVHANEAPRMRLCRFPQVQGVLTPVKIMVCLILFIAIPSPSATGFNGEISIIGNGDIDVNPLTPDHLMVTSRWITLTSNDINEQVVEITVDEGDAIASFNDYQRVPAGGSKSFLVHVIVPKNSPSATHQVVMNVRTVEREGIEVEDSGSILTGFLVRSMPFSLPILEPISDPFLVGSKGDEMTFSFLVTNRGNVNDVLSASVTPIGDENPPVEFNIFPGGGDVAFEERYTEDVEVQITGGLMDPQILRLEIVGGITHDPASYATILIVPEPEEENDDFGIKSPIYLAGLMITITISIVALKVILRRRTGEDDAKYESEMVGDHEIERGILEQDSIPVDENEPMKQSRWKRTRLKGKREPKQ